MGLKIVTGRTGTPHVSSNQIQAFNRSLLGDLAILDLGQHFDAVVRDANTIRIYDGCIVVQGIYAIIPHDEYEDVLVEPVSVGNTRIDTIYLHYAKDMETDTETVELDIAQGEEAVNNPVKPDIDAGGDTWEGTTDIRIPLYDVTVTSFETTIVPYEYMNVYSPTISELQERIPETTVSGVKGDAESEYRSGNVNITPTNIGLGNVDNTADTDKPVSNATQTALNLKADLTYVDAKIAAAYHAGGSKTVEELTSALLIADNMGKVYNMSDSGVTTADFVEGAGDPINEGDNVGICNVGTEESPIYKFDLLSGFVDLSAYATTSALNAGLAGKVDKVAGKGLSTNDYTNEEKQKLANIESNAQANVQSDWNEVDTEDDGYIKNKPDLSTSLTATGNPLTIESSESNLVECVAEVECVQEGSGEPSPTNIRPIIGQTEVVITQKDNPTNPTVTKTYTIQLGDTIYGGELDVITGELTVTHGYIESYNGEPLPSTWISDRDEYSEGATPTIGAQVVYELAEPYTKQLTPQQIRLLKGTNNISCNTENLSIKYYPDNVLGQLKGDIENEYDERVKTLETQTQELLPSLTFMSRERRNITSDLGRLSTAVAEQNLAKYGYKIGDYFTGASGYTYILADYNTFKGISTPYCITSNHLGIVVDTHKTSQWHSGDTSDVGYNGSVLNTFLKGTVLDNIKADFKVLFGGSTGLEHLIAHSKLYTTALASWAWQANQYISALTCTQIDAGSQWTANGFQEGEASKSLELFRKYKWTEIFGGEYPWLRDLSNYGTGDSCACYASGSGALGGDSGLTDGNFVVGLINFY